MYYVYILKSKKYDQIYTGSTNNLLKRLQNHNDGKEISTKRYMPWCLYYYESYPTEILARLREKRLKYNGNAMRELKKRIGLYKSGAGFTLLELLLAMAILIILGAIAFNAYYNFQLEVKVDEEANRVRQILRQVQQKAISGEQNSKWGARFVNATSSDQYYDVFYGDSYSTGTSTDRYYLATGIDFISPVSSSTLDIIFNKRTGANSSSSDITITIKTETSDIIKSVTTTVRGLIQ